MPDTIMGSAVVAAPANVVWEYHVTTIHARHNDVLQEKLTEYGKEGWELTFMTMPIPNEYQCVLRKPGR